MCSSMWHSTKALGNTSIPISTSVSCSARQLSGLSTLRYRKESCLYWAPYIHVPPLVVGSFQSPAQDSTPEPENEEPKAPPVVDVRIWHELVGQKVLESLIEELNTGGHTRLTIKENRDVVIRQNKKELMKTTHYSAYCTVAN